MPPYPLPFLLTLPGGRQKAMGLYDPDTGVANYATADVALESLKEKGVGETLSHSATKNLIDVHFDSRSRLVGNQQSAKMTRGAGISTALRRRDVASKTTHAAGRHLRSQRCGAAAGDHDYSPGCSRQRRQNG